MRTQSSRCEIRRQADSRVLEFAAFTWPAFGSSTTGWPIDPGAVQRECAAATLFDCPAVIARSHDGFDLWLQSSYAADFLTTAESFRTALERRALGL